MIRRFKAGSTEALCRIYEEYEGVMRTVAGSLRSYLTTCVANLARE